MRIITEENYEMFNKEELVSLCYDFIINNEHPIELFIGPEYIRIKYRSLR